MNEQWFDLRNLPPDFNDNPYIHYERLRRETPVYELPGGGLFLTRHADLLRIYKDRQVFSSDKKIEFGPKFGDGLLYQHHTTSLVFNDAPLHTR
ncbi:cytochrome P450, partial [Alphaproteobacteria bacterium]|nr:cytochrome P450 [Alphaproteobacteria bacterium]